MAPEISNPEASPVMQAIAPKPQAKARADQEALRIETDQKRRGQIRTELDKPNIEYGQLAFEGVQSDMLKGAPEIINNYIVEKLKEKGISLSPKQQEGVTLGLILRLIDKIGGMDGLMGSFTEKLSGVMKGLEQCLNQLKSGKFGEAAKSLESSAGIKTDGSKDKQVKEKDHIMQYLNGEIDTILADLIPVLPKIGETTLKINPAGLENPQLVYEFLGSKNQKAFDTPMDKEKMADFLANLNKKTIELDSKIRGADEQKEGIFNFIAEHLPKWGWLRSGITKTLSFLFEIPLIGSFLKKFFGGDPSDSSDTMVERTRLALEQAGSIHNLNKFSTSSDAPAILKGRDFSKIKRKNLDKFFGFFQGTIQKGVLSGAKPVDIEDDTFWKNIFENSGKTWTVKYKDSDGSEKDLGIQIPEIKDEDFDVARISGHLLHKKFCDKLNKIVELNTTKEVTKPQDAPPAPAPVPPVDPRAPELAAIVAFNLPKSAQEAISKITLDKVESDNAELGNLIGNFINSKNAEEKNAHGHLYTLVGIINSLKEKNELNGLLTQYFGTDKNLLNTTFAEVWAKRKIFIQKDLPSINLNIPTPAAQVGQPTQPQQGAPESSESNKLKEALMRAKSFPIETGVSNPKKISFEAVSKSGFSSGKLVLDGQKFEIKGKEKENDTTYLSIKDIVFPSGSSDSVQLITRADGKCPLVKKEALLPILAELVKPGSQGYKGPQGGGYIEITKVA